jgi:beta-alanine degradation protein BauB
MRTIRACALLFVAAGLFPALEGCSEPEARSLEAPQESAAAQPQQSAGAEPAVTQRFPQFENENVAVWRTVIAPNQPLNMHRHEYGRVIVALQGGDLKIIPENGESYTVTWETGKAYWLDADPPGTLHGDLYEGPGVMEVMVIEMRR